MHKLPLSLNSTLNEASYANHISKYFGTNHFEVEIRDINPIDYIDKIYDEPIIESSLISIINKYQI